MANKVGWIGLGRMGEAMVKRLTQAGHGVDVWNRTRSKAEPLVESPFLESKYKGMPLVVS